MFKHMLVPTDLTERNRKAMDIAVKMAVENKALVTIVHVVETLDDAADSDDFRKFFRQLGSAANRKMEKVITEYLRDGLSIEKQVLYGKRVYEILNFADTHAVDLIIMASHQHDPLNATEGWGTISFKVGVLSHCPVLLVK